MAEDFANGRNLFGGARPDPHFLSPSIRRRPDRLAVAEVVGRDEAAGVPNEWPSNGRAACRRPTFGHEKENGLTDRLAVSSQLDRMIQAQAQSGPTGARYSAHRGSYNFSKHLLKKGNPCSLVHYDSKGSEMIFCRRVL
jgi:hypothetical protein